MTEWSSQDDTRESVADLVGEIVRQKKERQQAAKEAEQNRGSQRTLLPVLWLLMVIAVGLTAWNLTRGGGPQL